MWPQNPLLLWVMGREKKNLHWWKHNWLKELWLDYHRWNYWLKHEFKQEPLINIIHILYRHWRYAGGPRAGWQHAHCDTTSRLHSTHTHIFVHYNQHYTTQSRKRQKASNGFKNTNLIVVRSSSSSVAAMNTTTINNHNGPNIDLIVVKSSLSSSSAAAAVAATMNTITAATTLTTNHHGSNVDLV